MKVLVAIDEGEFLDSIDKFISSREWPYRTNFRILHVVEPLSEIATLMPKPIVEMMASDAQQFGSCLVRRMAIRIRDHFKTEHVQEQVINGHAKDAIVEVAREWSADLIILGAHNRNPIERLRIGSVSAFVMAAAPCSVAIARPLVSNRKTTEPNSLAERDTSRV